jgi:hypothetical protein
MSPLDRKLLFYDLFSMWLRIAIQKRNIKEIQRLPASGGFPWNSLGRQVEVTRLDGGRGPFSVLPALKNGLTLPGPWRRYVPQQLPGSISVLIGRNFEEEFSRRWILPHLG